MDEADAIERDAGSLPGVGVRDRKWYRDLDHDSDPEEVTEQDFRVELGGDGLVSKIVPPEIKTSAPARNRGDD